MDRGLQAILDRAILGVQESHVICLADAVLRRGDKDESHGFFIDHQLHIIYPEQVEINGVERIRGIADVTVTVMRNNQPLIVIECKRNNLDNTVRDGRRQLQGYMLFGNFPHGVLMTNTTSYFFELNQEQFPTQTHVLSNATQIQEIINNIRNI